MQKIIQAKEKSDNSYPWENILATNL